MSNITPVRIRQFVSLFLNDVLYGIDIRVIKEITPPVTITPVPLRPPEVHGIVNIRGQVVLVLNIAVILGEKEHPAKSNSQIVILKTAREIRAVSNFRPPFDEEVLGDKPMGFLVDAVGDILSIEPSRIECAPAHLRERNKPYVEGIINLQPQPMVVLNVGRMMSVV